MALFIKGLWGSVRSIFHSDGAIPPSKWFGSYEGTGRIRLRHVFDYPIGNTNGITSSLRVDMSVIQPLFTGADHQYFGQKIEGIYASKLIQGSNDATLSFWAMSDVGGVDNVSLRNAGRDRQPDRQGPDAKDKRQ